MADYNHLVMSLLFLVRKESAALGGADAEQIEEIRRHQAAIDRLRVAHPCHIELSKSPGGCLIKYLIIAFQIEEIGGRNPPLPDIISWPALPDQHDPVKIGKGIWMKEEGVYHAENRCVGADA